MEDVKCAANCRNNPKVLSGKLVAGSWKPYLGVIRPVSRPSSLTA
jgi:hypothetical protein